MNLAKAIALASDVFQNKTDKADEPYILHCLRVMQNVRCSHPDAKIVAMLHDVVEDTIITFDDLRKMGFSDNIVRTVDLLTHRPEQPYDDYIKYIGLDDIATAVKLADLEDNSQITRLKGLGKKDFDRMEKYHRSYTYLSRR